MDMALTEEQTAIRDLAKQVLAGRGRIGAGFGDGAGLYGQPGAADHRHDHVQGRHAPPDRAAEFLK